jgi:hypothetical protein
VLLQGGSLGRGGGEDEPAVAARPGDRRQRQLGAVQPLDVALGQRHAHERPGAVVRPGVVLAAKEVRVAAIQLADQGAAVAAPVVEHADLAIVSASDHDDRLDAEGRRLVIARLSDLRLVADIHPRGGKDAVQLVLEHVPVPVDAGVHLPVTHEVVGLPQSGATHSDPPRVGRTLT